MTVYIFSILRFCFVLCLLYYVMRTKPIAARDVAMHRLVRRRASSSPEVNISSLDLVSAALCPVAGVCRLGEVSRSSMYRQFLFIYVVACDVLVLLCMCSLNFNRTCLIVCGN